MNELIFPLLGALLLGLLFFDVLITVFHPQGRGGPVNRTQNRWVWSLFRALGRRRDGAPRPELLAFCGPVLAVLTILTWAVLLIVGFTLVYYPFADTLRSSSDAVRSAWVKAAYYSGYTASTLGIGDVVPTTPALRLLTVVEAFAGFVLFGVAVTYVLAVYRELGVSATLALDISGYFRQGVGAVFRRSDRTGYDPAESWVDSTTRMLLRVTQAHSQYPIIHYFHSPDPQQALDLQLGQLIRLLKAAEAEESVGGATAARSPTLDALRRALETHMRETNRYVIPSGFEPLDARPEADLERSHRRMLHYMCYPEPEEVLGAGSTSGPGG